VRRALLIVLSVLILSGCGSGDEAAPLPETVVGTVEQPGGEGDPEEGKQVFAESGCGSCHTFDPAGSKGTVGPNLNELPQLAEKAGQGTLEEFTRTSLTNPNAYVEDGFQPGVMPAFTGSEDQLADLVAFLTQEQ
jgi:mono/diheme cytochrome c family protein